MSQLPTFRHLIKAIGEHETPHKTMFRYKVVEFRSHGGFIRIPDLFITKTKMRRRGLTNVYEVDEGFRTRLIDAAEFRLYKNAWDQLRVGLGYTPVNDEGE